MFGKIIVIALIGTVFSLLARKFVGPEAWGLGLTLAVVFWAYFERTVLRGVRAANKLGHERLALNMQLANVAEPVLLPVRVKFFAIVLLLLAGTYFGLRDEIALNTTRIMQIFQREEPIVRVEFPSYAEKPAAEIKLQKNEEPTVALDSGSYISFRIRNFQNATQWNVTLTREDTSNSTSSGTRASTAASLGGAGTWATSVSTLYEKLGVSSKESAVISALLSNNENDVYKVTFDVAAIPEPKVHIANSNVTGDELHTEEVPKLKFQVDVVSAVPLQNVELAVRTKSGYRFSKTLAEFANNAELNFSSDNAELITAGIPFAEDDVLYVRAQARSVLPNTGVSQELEFKVLSRQKIRQNIMKLVTETLAAFKDKESQFDLNKQDILKKLSEASQMATQLGLRSPTKRRLDDARAFSENMKTLDDKSAKAAQLRLQAILESLKREQSMENLSNLYARLQSMRSSVMKTTDENELKKLQEDAKTLQSDAKTLKNQLNSVINSNDNGLTLEEKQNAGQLMELDRTPERIDELSQELAKGNQQGASNAASQSIDELANHLGAAAQILMQARGRAMREAREALTEADRNLEDARNQDKNKARENVRSGASQLDKIPRLGKEIDSGVNEAREGASEAAKRLQNGNPDEELTKAYDKAQDGIVKALEALQDEEESQRASQRDYDEKSSRSTMDALAAQGQYDMGWRKSILDEIARLRSQGEASDSPIIRYLESRLR